jgi:hypothetical protein
VRLNFAVIVKCNMNNAKKLILNFVSGFFISLLLLTTSFSTTEFYLMPEDVQQKIDCDYVEIKNNQVICTDNSLLITYDFARIKNLEVVDEGKSFQVQHFTQETIERINTINSKKISSQKAGEQEQRKQTKYTSWMPDIAKGLSFDSYPNFVQSLQKIEIHQIGNSTLSMILLVSGLVVFLIGSTWYLIATFRVGILWGLSCMLLPFVSLIFLFVHWKVAAKPFFISMLGVAIAFSGTLFETAGEASSHFKISQPISKVSNKGADGMYKCSGKIYCSEMTSCAEATFYLRNCPGTKMDGNNDGVPCEKQWCGH